MDGLSIYGDWGVTNCRLWLVASDRVRDGVQGPGIMACDDPASTFAEMTAPWRKAHGPLPALLCGTVGANIGWVDAGYVPAPATLAEVCAAATEVGHVTILPGVKTAANAFGQPDVMRSEEVQVFGWLAETGRTEARLCLPGSHTKWVEVRNGRIANVTTGFVGELFAILRKHSILAPATGPTSGDVELGAAFDHGVATARTHPSLVSALFGPRAEAAANALSGADGRDRLSGLLVGADCNGMLDAWGGAPDAVIGSGSPAMAYVHSLSRLGHNVDAFDGERAVQVGLRMAFRELGRKLGRGLGRELGMGTSGRVGT